jgi:hypothetical protein
MNVVRTLGTGLLLAGLLITLKSPTLGQDVSFRAPVMENWSPELLQRIGIELQARGPVHEAYAQPVSLQPGPAAEAPRQPPEPLVEEPPALRPEGDDFQWVPGNWFWDVERNDFTWISGVYRKTPPGQKYVPGYWTFAAEAWQWVPGFWIPEEQPDVTYNPPPPESREAGPLVPPQEENSFYAPGYWSYGDGAYTWRPGCWMTMQANMVWIPPHYIWTPAGYVFVPGFYDYPPEDRGLLFAPVCFTQPVWQTPGYVYRPTFALSWTLVLDSFFYGPSRCHYYFGNYYGPAYANRGYQPWCNFGSNRFDPLFTYYNYRSNPGWQNGLRTTYVNRVNGQVTLPPRVVDSKNFNIQPIAAGNQIGNAPLLQLAALRGQKIDNLPRITSTPVEQFQQQQKAVRQYQQAGTLRNQLEKNLTSDKSRPKTGSPAKIAVQNFQIPEQAFGQKKTRNPGNAPSNAVVGTIQPKIDAGVKNFAPGGNKLRPLQNSNPPRISTFLEPKTKATLPQQSAPVKPLITEPRYTPFSQPKQNYQPPPKQPAFTQPRFELPKTITTQPKPQVTQPQTLPRVNTIPRPKIQNFQPKIQNYQPKIQNALPKIPNFQPKIQNYQPKIQNYQPKNNSSVPRISSQPNFSPSRQPSNSPPQIQRPSNPVRVPSSGKSGGSGPSRSFGGGGKKK